MGYERLRRIHGLGDEGIARYVVQVQAQALIVEPAAELLAATVPHDPQDDPILATALGGQADVLCTLDRHLRHPDVLNFCGSHGIRVLSDVELLVELQGGGSDRGIG